MRRLLAVALASTLVSVASTPAAPPAGRSASAESAAMDRLGKLYKDQAFSAKAVMTVTPSATSTKSHGTMPGPMEFLITMSGGKSRTEMDFGQMMGAQGGAMPGMDKMISISRPDKKVTYQIVPGMQAYAETAITEAAAGGAKPEAKVQRKVEGTETVDKYTCEKVRNTVTASDGTTSEVMTWEAKELNGLPVKMETETAESKMTMVFKDIKTGKPDESLFEPPAGYTKCGSMQELMMSGMMKAMPKRP